jgi:hypothetical protein
MGKIEFKRINNYTWIVIFKDENYGTILRLKNKNSFKTISDGFINFESFRLIFDAWEKYCKENNL